MVCTKITAFAQKQDNLSVNFLFLCIYSHFTSQYFIRMLALREIRFNRQELSGAFGDIGTDFPLVVAMIIAAGLHTPSVLIMLGLLQIATGLIYRMPMPVQPLKAMAALVISQKVVGPVLLGAGLAIGLVMLVLSLTGALDKLARFVPRPVIRGIQMGLGLSLSLLAFKDYIAADQAVGYVLAFVAFLVVVLFMDKKALPVAFVVIVLGMVYAFAFKVEITVFRDALGFNLPVVYIPTVDDIAKGFVLLALPQIPLSLGNSIIATRQVAEDLFPDRPPLTVRGIGITYASMNLLAPLLSGIPCCHGSGGMVGHYAFGGRTGGSVIIYGLFYMTLGLFFSDGFESIIQVFPLPVLGVILLFEGIALILLVKDTIAERRHFVIAVLTGVMAAGLPYGFIIALVVGTILFYSPLKMNVLANMGTK